MKIYVKNALKIDSKHRLTCCYGLKVDIYHVILTSLDSNMAEICLA